MNWGIDFSGELQKMKEEMDRQWIALFGEKENEGEKQAENPAKPEQTRKNRT
jgi:hypothetical protein